MRLDDQSAYVLHRRPYSETSQILELLTRDHGRVAALAKGSRKGNHNRLRCEPFQQLSIDLRGNGELPLLVRVEPVLSNPPALLTGLASLAGLYLNELLIAVLQRDDPHRQLFEHYGQCLAGLQHDTAFSLRRFEWIVLNELGYAPDLSVDEQGLLLEPQLDYEFSPHEGLRPKAQGRFSGAMLLALRDGQRSQLEGQRRFLREQLALHLDHAQLRSWQLLRELEQVMPAGK